MITAAQLRAARALLGVDQRELAALSDLSVPTIQRMEGREGLIRGNVDSLMKLVGALDAAGIELIGDDKPSHGGGRGVRLKETQVTVGGRIPKSPKPARSGSATRAAQW
jgi:transcriptional regulator with XRE-family HTH domain